MLSIKALTNGIEDYFLELATEHYYFHGGEPPGKWSGKGAEKLGLVGKVKPQQFRNLFYGFHPDSGDEGDKIGLVQNAGVADRQPGWDLTFSLPKSVSVIWSQASPEMRQQIQDILQRAVEKTIAYIEKTLGFSRIGKGGTNNIAVGLVVSTFFHSVSRTLDPQMHVHCLFHNSGIDDDGNWRSILSKPFYYYKKSLGAYFRAVAANMLENELHLPVERKGQSFEVIDVPQDLIDFRSTRSKQINAYVKKTGGTGAIDASKANLATRRTKQDTPPWAVLFPRWQEENKPYRFTEDSIRKLQRTPARNSKQDLASALKTALKNLSKTHAHFAYKDLLYEALLEAPARGLPPELIVKAVQDYLTTGKDCVRLRSVEGIPRYTTKKMLALENRLLAAIKRLQQASVAQISDYLVEKVLAKHPELTVEQILAVRHLTQSPGALQLLSSPAGTGKSSKVTSTVCEILKLQGYDVIGTVPTGKAAGVLQNDTGIPSATIHRRLAEYKLSLDYKLKHHAKQLYRALRHKRTYRLESPQPVKITKKTVLVVDEAGMTNLYFTRRLLERVADAGGKLIMLGDPYQLPPVDGTAPFRSMCERVGCAKLHTIMRQKDEWAREAVSHFVEGNPGKALALYAAHNMVTTRDSMDEALAALVGDWTELGLTTPETIAILVDTNQHSEQANQLCQQKRLNAGCFDTTKAMQIVDHDRNRGTTYTNQVYAGDRVVCTKNDRKLNVENGSVGTVISLKPFRKAIVVRLDDGRIVVIPVKKYQHIRLGYALTTYRSQGGTYKHVAVLVGGPMQDLPTSYVQGSRSVLSTRFYTEKTLFNSYLSHAEDTVLAKQMSRAPDLLLASDLLPDPDDSRNAAADPTRPFAIPIPMNTHGKYPGVCPAKHLPQSSEAEDDLQKRLRDLAQTDKQRRKRRKHKKHPPVIDCFATLEYPETLLDFDLAQVPLPHLDPLETTCLQSRWDFDVFETIPSVPMLHTGFSELLIHAEVMRLQEEQEQQAAYERLRQMALSASDERPSSYPSSAAAGTCSSPATPFSSTAISIGSTLGSCSSIITTPNTYGNTDYQQYLMAGAAQTQWTQNMYHSTTTEFRSI